MKKANRPVIRFPLSPVEIGLEILAAIGLVFIVVAASSYWPQLPEEVPKHFNIKGQPDAWGSRNWVWVIPIVSVLLYALLIIVQRVPHIYNYPWPITGANAPKQYALARELMGMLKLLLMVNFTFINWFQIQTALGRQTGLGAVLIPWVLGSMAVVLTVYFVRAYRAR